MQNVVNAASGKDTKIREECSVPLKDGRYQCVLDINYNTESSEAGNRFEGGQMIYFQKNSGDQMLALHFKSLDGSLEFTKFFILTFNKEADESTRPYHNQLFLAYRSRSFIGDVLKESRQWKAFNPVGMTVRTLIKELYTRPVDAYCVTNEVTELVNNVPVKVQKTKVSFTVKGYKWLLKQKELEALNAKCAQGSKNTMASEDA